MFEFRDILIKQFFNFQVVRNIPGEMLIKFPNYIDCKFEKYNIILEEGIKLLKGIKSIQFDYSRNLIGINYNIKKMDSKILLYWIKIVIETLVDNSTFIEKNFNVDIDIIILKVKSDLLIKRNKFN
ncbi:hypothetical protein [Clostridium septicum]|uniref:Uncharacterized protein n=1 Tax=Clostridium septicum TaxID=1504 RepID=A0A9N7JJP2_CLOSE|nr:hypothetical protein [Clostridium septicum]AYE33007.1 hypothetical protein CP523_00345 [Clostridium septicum]MDU1313397.1 hypothetical protein [Clostridium septicum]QAS61175.1 hypothetical protein EI377_10835 [Clostridium septicum]UEC19478.1 hypothetical protein LK444_08560 [Clostridium septicum]USR99570.1 hypothetical protein NH397_08625 [Clostridium septicum]